MSLKTSKEYRRRKPRERQLKLSGWPYWKRILYQDALALTQGKRPSVKGEKKGCTI